MKLLVDMNLSPQWKQVLAGFCTVHHWSDLGKPDAPDHQIMQWAKDNGCVLFTNDLDFGAILAATGFSAPSVFQVRSLVLDPAVIGQSVLHCLKQVQQDLAEGALVSFDIDKSRVRKLPLK